MWRLAMLALASVSGPPSAHQGLIVGGTAFGPRQTLTCNWFTNFENSRFERCRGAGGNLLLDEGASIKCLARTCDQLDAAARRVAHWRKPEPPWGNFTVRLAGRIGLYRHEKQYLGDGTATVLIEKLLSVRPSK